MLSHSSAIRLLVFSCSWVIGGVGGGVRIWVPWLRKLDRRWRGPELYSSSAFDG